MIVPLEHVKRPQNGIEVILFLIPVYIYHTYITYKLISSAEKTFYSFGNGITILFFSITYS